MKWFYVSGNWHATPPPKGRLEDLLSDAATWHWIHVSRSCAVQLQNMLHRIWQQDIKGHDMSKKACDRPNLGMYTHDTHETHAPLTTCKAIPKMCCGGCSHEPSALRQAPCHTALGYLLLTLLPDWRRSSYSGRPQSYCCTGKGWKACRWGYCSTHQAIWC